MAQYRKKPIVIEAFRYEIDEPPRWFQHAEGTVIDCVTGYGSPEGSPQPMQERWPAMFRKEPGDADAE